MTTEMIDHREVVQQCLMWGIEEELMIKIFELEQQGDLCQFMFITGSGDVFAGKDEDDLKEQILEYMQEIGCIDDIEYIFINGESQNVEVDIKFTDHSQ